MPKEANNKNQSKDKKHYMKDFKAELKRVIWPTSKQLTNNTVAVITIVLITAVLVFALDFTFEKINTFGIEKIKSVVGVEEKLVDDHDHDHDHDHSLEENTNEASEIANTVEKETDNTVEE